MKIRTKISNRLPVPAASGFTLIELMVVISIMAIMATIAIPVIRNAVDAGRRAQAQTEVSALAVALRAYLNAYSVWPSLFTEDGSETEVAGNVMRVLAGENINNANPREIMFMEFPEHAISEWRFVDAWGHNTYRFAVDYNYNNEVTARLPDGEITLQQRVAVWSLGESDRSGNVTGPPITSWGYSRGQ